MKRWLTATAILLAFLVGYNYSSRRAHDRLILPLSAAGAPHAYVLPTRLTADPASATSFLMECQVIVGDGTNPPANLTVTFAYDATQTSATELAALKSAVVAGAPPPYTSLSTGNIIVFTAAN